ncbi:TPA: helix-turn-helix domain-containing protein [Streptococcus suis]
MLNQHLAQQVREQSFAGYVQQELYSAIPSGFFLVEDIAHRLGVSVRTLQRNLSAENTSFKQELQAVQKAMTFSYLKMKLPAEEISSLIGYSEVNAFSRAFKKWTGMTVTDYKKQQGL